MDSIRKETEGECESIERIKDLFYSGETDKQIEYLFKAVYHTNKTVEKFIAKCDVRQCIYLGVIDEKTKDLEKRFITKSGAGVYGVAIVAYLTILGIKIGSIDPIFSFIARYIFP